MITKILNNVAILLINYIASLGFCWLGLYLEVPIPIIIFGGLVCSIFLSSVLAKWLYKEDNKSQ